MTVVLDGLKGPVVLFRDPLGIPHVKAGSVADAFFAQGYIHAEDRLWQMESDRRRAAGRWAEVVGQAGVAQDRLMRSFQLYETARQDFEGVAPESRAMLEAYAAGVNAWVASAGEDLPAEFALTGISPEPWQPWDGLAVYKVRHILMGVWEGKLWRAKLLAQVGPEMLAALYPGTSAGELLIDGGRFTGTREVQALIDQLTEAMAHLEWLKEDGGGSNNWVLDGARTASGLPLLAGDPHRAVDVPNVYYQNHVACDAFDVIGLSFPGLPGFPHFGQNGSVAWCITHVGADTQDLFIERFDPEAPSRYLFKGEWREAMVRQELIQVRGAEPVPVTVTITHHGPVIAGEPASGQALTLRYTATLGKNSGWDCLLPMLTARTCAEFDAAMPGWVDPVNNLLYADVHGASGYRMRGLVPVRHGLHAWLPAPGWTGEYEWEGYIPFAELPHWMTAPGGAVVTANNRVVGAEYPYYIGLTFAADYRARRIADRLAELERATAEDMAAVHADVLSLPSRELLPLLSSVEAQTEAGAQAKALLLAWDGQMKADRVEPAIYSLLRTELVEMLLRPILGPLAAEAFETAGRGGPHFLSLIRQRMFELAAAGERSLLPPGAEWGELIGQALERAVAALQARLGPEMGEWQWGKLHQLRPVHLLGAAFPEAAAALAPAPAPVDGDPDTVAAASYVPATGFTVTGTSVARYVFDLGDWERSAWVVPHGASGQAGSPHFADQAEAWRAFRLFPMYYDWARIEAVAESCRRLVPPSAE